MRCLEKPVLRARTGCEISALHGNWSAVEPGVFFGAILQSDLFESPAVPKIFVDMC